MGHNIKHLRPKKNSMFKQGYINRDMCKKLFESTRTEPIIFRSSWEKKFIEWCESSALVLRWGSECCPIPYVIGKETHTYYPDFILTTTTGETWMVEIKPYNETQRPKQPNSYAWNVYCKNMCKWRAAIAFCQARGWKFKVFTEKTINKL